MRLDCDIIYSADMLRGLIDDYLNRLPQLSLPVVEDQLEQLRLIQNPTVGVIERIGELEDFLVIWYLHPSDEFRAANTALRLISAEPRDLLAWLDDLTTDWSRGDALLPLVSAADALDEFLGQERRVGILENVPLIGRGTCSIRVQIPDWLDDVSRRVQTMTTWGWVPSVLDLHDWLRLLRS